jgi:peptidoglycan hydrolase-like protein with peptidoglycan-binding domain
MMSRVTIFAATLLAGVSTAVADPAVVSTQQALKDQGFYYGEITGTKDADTTAAIRRYQIRNGLQVTGDLNAETRKSLGVKGTGAATPPPVRSTPPPAPVRPDTSDLRDDSPDVQEPPVRQGSIPRDPADAEPGYDDEPAYDEEEPRVDRLDLSDIFADTPYETAPPDLQQRVIAGAQSILSRSGFYRSGIDGIYGPGTEFALRAYQSRLGLEPSGRFDMETLASLRLLPGPQAPVGGGNRRIYRRPPVIIGPAREPIYIPN